MIESKITMKRKDYVTICEKLKEIDVELYMYANINNKNLVEATRRKISLILNLLEEDC